MAENGPGTGFLGSHFSNSGLVISVQTKDEWSYAWNRTMHFYEQKLNMSDAEDFCISQGKHLASITSEEEESKLASMFEHNFYDSVWLGGKRNFKEQKPWHWIDGRLWGFEKWSPYSWENFDCIAAFVNDIKPWMKTKCSESHSFVCLDASKAVRGDQVFTLKKKSFLPSSFHIWWDFSLTKNAKACSGIQISWRIENGTVDRREFVSSEISGTVSTPGLGNSKNDSHETQKKEYTAVLNLPDNILDILDDGALVVDIDVTVAQSDSRVQLWSSGLSKQYGTSSWGGAQMVCMTKGGHIPSVTSSVQWQKVQDFLAEHKLTSAWLGGSDKRREAEWFWSDGRKWSFTHWAAGQPDNKGFDEDCLMTENGTWVDTSCDNLNVAVVCEVPKLVHIESDTQLIFTRDNVSNPALQLTWTSQNSGTQYIGGFKLTWRVRKKQCNFGA